MSKKFWVDSNTEGDLRQYSENVSDRLEGEECAQGWVHCNGETPTKNNEEETFEDLLCPKEEKVEKYESLIVTVTVSRQAGRQLGR